MDELKPLLGFLQQQLNDVVEKTDARVDNVLLHSVQSQASTVRTTNPIIAITLPSRHVLDAMLVLPDPQLHVLIEHVRGAFDWTVALPVVLPAGVTPSRSSMHAALAALCWADDQLRQQLLTLGAPWVDMTLEFIANALVDYQLPRLWSSS